MNARETTLVMLMQTVLTPKVRTTAPVKMGTEETEEIVQVSRSIANIVPCYVSLCF